MDIYWSPHWSEARRSVATESIAERPPVRHSGGGGALRFGCGLAAALHISLSWALRLPIGSSKLERMSVSVTRSPAVDACTRAFNKLPSPISALRAMAI